MSSGSISLSRVSFQQSSSLLLNSLQFEQSNLLTVQQQISTGNRLSLGSDDPGATLAIQSLNRQIANNTQYQSNLNFASGFLGQADSSLQSLSTLLNSAKSLASSQIDSTADERASQAQVVDSYLSQVMDLGNTQYNGQYVFGGQNTASSPFISTNGGYQYVGSAAQQGILTPTGSQIQFTVDGSQVFGATSAQVIGYQNISPDLTPTTRLADVGSATGGNISLGHINITVGSTALDVDLSQAATAGDVVNTINAALTAAGSDANVALSANSIIVHGDSSQAVSISDVANGTTAADLSIKTTLSAGANHAGAALSPRVTLATPLGALNGGLGIDPSGFIITSGSTSTTIKLTGLSTVSDLINKINQSAPGVKASLNAAGTGINVVNTVSGTPLTIGENGGNTADQLGIRSFNPNTLLSGLNNGEGVTPINNTIGGPTGNITITRTDGTSFNVAVDGIKTSSQLIAAINAASGGTVTAALNANDNGITLTDSAGGSGNLSVAAGQNYISNGSDFGIFQTGSGSTLTGTSAVYSTDDFRVTRKDGTSFTVNLTGASTVQDVLNAINNADGNTNPANQVTASLNATGNGIQLSDASTGGGSLTVSSLNSSQAASQLGILKTAASATSGTINGDDTNPLQPQGIFNSLLMLRDALLNNDTAGITRAATLLQQDNTRVINANGVVAARGQDISTRLTQATDQQTTLNSSLSLVSQTDMTSAITKYQSLETAYEAALKVASTTNNLSLLDFLQ